MAHETEKSIGEYTHEIPYYEVPVFTSNVERKIQRMEELCGEIEQTLERCYGNHAFFNISNDRHHPIELALKRDAIDVLQKTIQKQREYLGSVDQTIPDDAFTESDDMPATPRWHRFFPTKL